MSVTASQKNVSGALVGAAFLMATSAIGPGFITQTTVFTQQLLTSFGFVILISIVLDVVAQLNTWRIITVSGMPAPEIANQLYPGLGVLLSILVAIGGLAFNIGNVAGAGLGLNVLTGMDTLTGAIVSGILAILLFLKKEAGRVMDRFASILGLVMIALTFYVAFQSHPPITKAVQHSLLPEKISMVAIVTLVGGTVGGYISFAGAHRLLDAGIAGTDSLKAVSKSSIQAIMIAGVMRILLFLAALGVVMAGATIDTDNPAASVFQYAAGNMGYKIFGMVLWAAAITSVVGAAYTSVSFLKTIHPIIKRKERAFIIFFIFTSTLFFAFIGKPIKVLVMVGTLNGFILPLGLGIILVAAVNSKIVGAYKHPVWMQWAGWVVVMAMLLMGMYTVYTDLPKIWNEWLQPAS